MAKQNSTNISQDANTYLNGLGLFTTPSSGDLVYVDGSVPAGNTVANTVTETALTSSYTIPAGTLIANNVIRIRLAGLYSTDVVAPMITAKIKIGSVVVATTGTITAVAAVTNGGYTGFLDVIVTNAGASGVVESQGFVEFATAATTALTVNLKNTAAVSGIDFTAAQTVTITIQWGTAAVANTLTMRQMELYIDKIGSVLGATAGGVLSGTYPNPGFGSFTSATLAAALSDETGTGANVFGTTPTIATPVINGISTGTGVATAATANTLSLRDTNGNISANNVLKGSTTTATAAGTTTLTVASTYLQFFTGITTQTVALPVTSTLVLGQELKIVNNSTGVVTVQSSGLNTILAVAAGTSAMFNVILTSGTTAASWSYSNLAAGGGGGSPGGSTTQLQYNNAGAFGGMSGTAWNDTNRSLAITGATVTTSNPVFDLSQTWNAGAVTFTGIKTNITNTASAAASLLMDLQVGGASLFNVRKDGAVSIGIATPGAQLHVNSTAAATKGIIIQGATSQSGNLFEIQPVGGTVWARIFPAGADGVSLYLSGHAAGGTGRGLTITPSNTTGITNFATDIAAGISVDGVVGINTASTSMNYAANNITVGRNVSGTTFSLLHGTIFADTAARSVILTSGDAYTSAVTNTTGGAFSISGGSAGIINTNGGAVTLTGGLGRGTGIGGSVIFQTSDVVASGTTLQSATTRMSITSTGVILLGSGTDTGFSRNAAGVIEVNSGTAGTFRDLKLRSLLLAGSTSGTATLNAPAVASTYVYTAPSMTTTLQSVGTTTETTNTATVIAIAGNNHVHTITALATANTFGVPTVATGALTDMSEITIRIKDNAVARALTWNAIFRAVGVTLPLTTVVSKTLYVKGRYNVADVRWDILAIGQE